MDSVQWWVILSWIVSISFSICIMWCLPTDEKEKLSETETEQSEQEQEEEKMYNQMVLGMP